MIEDGLDGLSMILSNQNKKILLLIVQPFLFLSDVDALRLDVASDYDFRMPRLCSYAVGKFITRIFGNYDFFSGQNMPLYFFLSKLMHHVGSQTWN